MTEQTVTKPAEKTDEQRIASHSWKRRGLIAAAWAAVAAIVARQTTEPVEAGVDGDVVLGVANTTTGITAITNSTQSSDALDLFCTGGTDGFGLQTVGSGFGVVATNTGARGASAGVYGSTPRADNYGVWGDTVIGVGVLGQSNSGIAIRGQVAPGSSANTIAIYGLNNSSYTGATPGAGGFAVYGLCAKGHGLVGATATAGGAAVVGATNGVAGAYAGAFYGPLVVSGAFTVFGGPKSAAVLHPDGTHRRLYCMESPESWFEDFGESTLECGQAEVMLDPDFAAVADLSKYHVFLTGYNGQSDLSVCERTSSGFQVRAASATGSGSFSWRVVAKRKDIPAPRFETVTVPHEPVLPSPPQAQPVAPAPRHSRPR
jgi:hypothetical protein